MDKFGLSSCINGGEKSLSEAVDLTWGETLDFKVAAVAGLCFSQLDERFIANNLEDGAV